MDKYDPPLPDEEFENGLVKMIEKIAQECEFDNEWLQRTYDAFMGLHDTYLKWVEMGRPPLATPGDSNEPNQA